MIKTRDDLQDYLDKDKRALGMKKRRPFLATVSGGVENKSLWPDCSTSIGNNWRMV